MLIFLSCCSCWCDHRMLPPSSLFKSTFSMASKLIFPSSQLRNLSTWIPSGVFRFRDSSAWRLPGATGKILLLLPNVRRTAKNFCQTFLCNLSPAENLSLGSAVNPNPQTPLLPCKRLALEYRQLFHRCFRSSTVFEDHVTVGACPLQRLTPQKTND